MFDMYDLYIRIPIKHTSLHSPYSQKLGGNKNTTNGIHQNDIWSPQPVFHFIICEAYFNPQHAGGGIKLRDNKALIKPWQTRLDANFDVKI